MTDSNREDAQAELKQVIAESYGNKTLWTTDWDGLQLKRCVSARHASTPVHSSHSVWSLTPKPTPVVSSHSNLKRKA